VFQQQKNISHADVLLKEHLLREDTQWTEYKIRTLNEEQKSAVVDNIVTKLFQDIKSKSLNVDFAILDDSKGNIKKVANYKVIDNAINYLNKFASEHSKKVPELREAVDEIQLTWTILHKYNSQFEYGFKYNSSIVRYLYNSLSIAVIQGTSFLVAESVEFVKDNLNLYKAQPKNSKNIKRNNYIKSLKTFNTLERNGQLVKLFKETQQFSEAGVGAILSGAKGLIAGLPVPAVGKVIAVIGLIGFALMSIRAIIFVYFDTRVRLSQYLKHLKDFVEMNALTLGNDAKAVKERQMKIAQSLGKLADVVSVDQNVANDRSSSQIEQSNKVIALGNKDPNSSANTDLDLY
jgi:hypothetical protein